MLKAGNADDRETRSNRRHRALQAGFICLTSRRLCAKQISTAFKVSYSMKTAFSGFFYGILMAF
jgi:hypothetical protein